MTTVTSEERNFLEFLSELTYCNPFLPRRMELERSLLGKSSRAVPTVWSYSDDENIWENSGLISSRLRPLADKMLAGFKEDGWANDEEIRLYEDLLLYFFYDTYRPALNSLIADYSPDGNHRKCMEAWQAFLLDFRKYTQGMSSPEGSLLKDPAHLWACFFQIQRLFYHVFFCIVGTSNATIRLRASIWQSLLTHNLRRYVRSLHQCMGNLSTLITGPSGTGKELVARAISLSQYVPFDPNKGEFVADYSDSWMPVHLAAMSPTLIESELFGHRKGAFTGATEDRKGVFASCGQFGAVFLDEIGELDAEIQVKLLRVLQNRTFQRLGDLETCSFDGKVIAATNRDFAKEIESGNFRMDLYYRLCSDMICTPSLNEQLADQPDDLRRLIEYQVQVLGFGDHEEIVSEVLEWIETNLGPSYTWPGNVRELEQCMRNIMIRGEYKPAHKINFGVREEIGNMFNSGTLTADELLTKYCTMIYSQTGSYEESARRLKIDRRTVKSKVDEVLLEKLKSSS